MSFLLGYGYIKTLCEFHFGYIYIYIYTSRERERERETETETETETEFTISIKKKVHNIRERACISILEDSFDYPIVEKLTAYKRR